MKIVGALSGLIVRDSAGNVDCEATANAVTAALVSELEATAVRDSEIEVAINDVFARLNVDVYNTQLVVAMAATVLAGNDLAGIGTISEEVKDYLSRSNKFASKRGRNGGLCKL